MFHVRAEIVGEFVTFDDFKEDFEAVAFAEDRIERNWDRVTCWDGVSGEVLVDVDNRIFQYGA